MKSFHKTMAWIARIVLGATFVFSGFVKAVDPLGTTYKIQDYLQAFGWGVFYEYSLFFAVALISFEMVLGFTLLLGSWQRTVSAVTALYMLAMTLLTLYIALRNPVSDCGCFGDAIVLSNRQTFEKNVVLLLLSLLLWLYREPLYQVFGRRTSVWALILALAIPLFICHLSYRHLPLLDFRPYKTGTHLIDKMIVPEGAPLDSVVTEYIYEKDGRQRRFTLADYPAGDTTWHFVDRREKVIRRGYVPPIHDFEIMHPYQGDITEDILSDPNYCFLFVCPRLDKTDRRSARTMREVQDYALRHDYRIYGLTASPSSLVDEWKYEYDLLFDFCSVDEITLKTVIRSNPGLVLLKDGTVYNKWAWRDIPSLSRQMDEPLSENNAGRMRDGRDRHWMINLIVGALLLYVVLYVFRGASLINDYVKRKKNKPTN
ncbi:MAG: DoxX family protein [Bacteroidales bacterium]|nr:DoxX family protein [Bacteroidales bacterium]